MGARAFITKDSGRREEFPTGAVRDTSEGKGRFDLLYPPAIRREAQLYERGAKKYTDNNWKKGIKSSRFMESLLRHAFQYLGGDRTEDHLAAVRWNAAGIIYNEEEKQDQHDLAEKVDNSGGTENDGDTRSNGD